MNAACKSIFRSLFNIYPGEERRALTFAFLGFIWAFGATCGLKFADALFLFHVGADALPQTYTFIACGMFLLAVVLLYAFHYFSSYAIYRAVLLTGMSFYLFVLICLVYHLEVDSLWLWYTLKLAGFFFFAVLMTCYWTFIDQYHHLQDAKRLYSLFSSTIFLGAASTGSLMHTGLLDIRHVLILIMCLFGISDYWVRTIAQSMFSMDHNESGNETSKEGEGPFLKFFFRSILASPFTLLLMTNNFLIYLLLVITEYNYMLTFEHHFTNHPGVDAGDGTNSTLMLFLGKCLATVSATNLLIGLFIYSRLVKRLGLNKLLLITPLLLIIAFTGWSLSTNLFFPLIGFFVVEGTLYVIDDSNFNLLLNVVPTKLKYKIRVIIESFFEPIGMLTSAALLTFFHDYTKWLGLILAMCTLGVATALSANYLKAIFFNLSNSVSRFRTGLHGRSREISDQEQQEAEPHLFALLGSKDEPTQLLACEALLAFKKSTTLERLLEQTPQMSLSTRIQFMNLLESTRFAKHSCVLTTVRQWAQQDYPPELFGAAHLYLAKQGLLHPNQMVETLHHANIQLQGAAIIALQNVSAYLSADAAAPLQTLASHHLRWLLNSPHEEQVCMGLEVLSIHSDAHDMDALFPYLHHPSLQVVRVAARSIGRRGLSDPLRQVPQIIAQLRRIDDHQARLACLISLKRIDDPALINEMVHSSAHFRSRERRLIEEVIANMGAPAIPTLTTLLCNPQISDCSRLIVGRVLGRIAPLQLQVHLPSIIHENLDRAYLHLYHHYALRSGHEEAGIFKEMLITRHLTAVDFILQLLSISWEGEYGELLSRSLQSRNPKVRSQAVEALEKRCEPAIFRLLQPLVDDAPYEEKIKACLKKFRHNAWILNDLLDRLSQSSAYTDQIMASAMKFHWMCPTHYAPVNMREESTVRVFTPLDKAFLLKRIQLFQELDLDALLAIAEKLGSLLCKAHQPIFLAEEEATCMYLIADGTVEIRWVKSDRVCILGKGDFFGEEALFSHTPRHYTALATNEVHLLTLAHPNLQLILSECPTVAAGFLRAYAFTTPCRPIQEFFPLIS